MITGSYRWHSWHYRAAGTGGKQAEIARAQGGVRAWVLRSADEGGHGLREGSAPVLASLLCAAAFAPLVAAGAGVSGAGPAGVAGIEVLSSVADLHADALKHYGDRNGELLGARFVSDRAGVSLVSPSRPGDH